MKCRFYTKNCIVSNLLFHKPNDRAYSKLLLLINFVLIALQRRAMCYSEIHDLPNAINDCRQILKLNPNNKYAEVYYLV